MTTHQSTSGTFPSPLVPFGDKIFRIGEYTDTGALSTALLPFASWDVPNGPDEDTGMQFGRRAAAALTIHMGHLGSEAHVSLRSIVSDPDFQKDLSSQERSGHTAAWQFIRQIERYLWALAQLVSPAQLAADAETAIAENDYCNEESTRDVQENESEGSDPSVPDVVDHLSGRAALPITQDE